MQRTATSPTRPSRTGHTRSGGKKGNGNARSGRRQSGEKRFRLGRLQRLVLTAVAETEKRTDPTPLAELSRMVASVRGHNRRPDRKKVHKNTFYRAVQGLCEKGYVQRGSTARGLRLLKKGRRVIEERTLSWEREKDSARRVERRLLRRQVEWRKTGKRVGGTRCAHRLRARCGIPRASHGNDRAAPRPFASLRPCRDPRGIAGSRSAAGP